MPLVRSRPEDEQIELVLLDVEPVATRPVLDAQAVDPVPQPRDVGVQVGGVRLGWHLRPQRFDQHVDVYGPSGVQQQDGQQRALAVPAQDRPMAGRALDAQRAEHAEVRHVTFPRA